MVFSATFNNISVNTKSNVFVGNEMWRKWMRPFYDILNFNILLFKSFYFIFIWQVFFFQIQLLKKYEQK